MIHVCRLYVECNAYTLAMWETSKRLNYNLLSTRTYRSRPRNRWSFLPMSSLLWADHNKYIRSRKRMFWSNTCHFPIFRFSLICHKSACMMLLGSFLMCPNLQTSLDQLCTQFLEIQIELLNINTFENLFFVLLDKSRRNKIECFSPTTKLRELTRHKNKIA